MNKSNQNLHPDKSKQEVLKIFENDCTSSDEENGPVTVIKQPTLHEEKLPAKIKIKSKIPILKNRKISKIKDRDQNPISKKHTEVIKKTTKSKINSVNSINKLLTKYSPTKPAVRNYSWRYLNRAYQSKNIVKSESCLHTNFKLNSGSVFPTLSKNVGTDAKEEIRKVFIRSRENLCKIQRNIINKSIYEEINEIILEIESILQPDLEKSGQSRENKGTNQKVNMNTTGTEPSIKLKFCLNKSQTVREVSNNSTSFSTFPLSDYDINQEFNNQKGFPKMKQFSSNTALSKNLQTSQVELTDRTVNTSNCKIDQSFPSRLSTSELYIPKQLQTSQAQLISVKVNTDAILERLNRVKRSCTSFKNTHTIKENLQQLKAMEMDIKKILTQLNMSNRKMKAPNLKRPKNYYPPSDVNQDKNIHISSHFPRPNKINFEKDNLLELSGVDSSVSKKNLDVKASKGNTGFNIYQNLLQLNDLSHFRPKNTNFQVNQVTEFCPKSLKNLKISTNDFAKLRNLPCYNINPNFFKPEVVDLFTSGNICPCFKIQSEDSISNMKNEDIKDKALVSVVTKSGGRQTKGVNTEEIEISTKSLPSHNQGGKCCGGFLKDGLGEDSKMKKNVVWRDVKGIQIHQMEIVEEGNDYEGNSMVAGSSGVQGGYGGQGVQRDGKVPIFVAIPVTPPQRVVVIEELVVVDENREQQQQQQPVCGVCNVCACYSQQRNCQTQTMYTYGGGQGGYYCQGGYGGYSGYGGYQHQHY